MMVKVWAWTSKKKKRKEKKEKKTLARFDVFFQPHEAYRSSWPNYVLIFTHFVATLARTDTLERFALTLPYAMFGHLWSLL